MAKSAKQKPPKPLAASAIIAALDFDLPKHSGKDLPVFSPVDGGKIASLKTDAKSTVTAKIKNAVSAFAEWREVPAPIRGELIRLFGEELRKDKENLAQLVTLECGKVLAEGRGEVQEMIDICDFAVGISRQVYGLTIASERPGHVMQETWHPLGPVAVISAFNFPVACVGMELCARRCVWQFRALETFGKDAAMCLGLRCNICPRCQALCRRRA